MNGERDLGAHWVCQWRNEERRRGTDLDHFCPARGAELAYRQVAPYSRPVSTNDSGAGIVKIERTPGLPISTPGSQAPGVVQASGLSKNLIHNVTTFPP